MTPEERQKMDHVKRHIQNKIVNDMLGNDMTPEERDRIRRFIYARARRGILVERVIGMAFGLALGVCFYATARGVLWLLHHFSK